MKKVKTIVFIFLIAICLTGCESKKQNNLLKEYNLELKDKILADNKIRTEYDLGLASNENEENPENGLYSTNSTNGGKTTYFFRGEVNNNYLSLNSLKWRIVRINEDGSVRIILDTGLNSNSGFKFGANTTDYQNMYYENSSVKEILDKWYEDNLKDYDDKIVEGSFCQDFKVIESYFEQTGDGAILYNSYKPSYTCKDVLKLKVGLLSIDEVSYAGARFRINNEVSFLNNSQYFWTMSPAGYDKRFNNTYEWIITNTGALNIFDLEDGQDFYVTLRPVINLKADTIIKYGNGTFNSPYVVK